MNVSCQSIMNTERPNQGFLDLKAAGINRIFLPICAKPSETDEKGTGNKNCAGIDQKCYERLIQRCGEEKIQIAFLRAPHMPLNVADHDILALTEGFTEECLLLCKLSGCRMLLIEPLFETPKCEEHKRLNYEYFVRMAGHAYEYGVTLLLKNQVSMIGGHMVRGFCAEAGTANRYLDQLNSKLGYEAFGFCIDSGICNICGTDTHTMITALGKRIKAVILRDCDRKHNMAMLPFTCTGSGTDWSGVIRGLREIAFDGELAIDFSSTYSTFSPLLRPVLYQLVKAAAAYLKWQIEIEQNLRKYREIVLFGAGNMCQAYMKCYGEKYPPLFTCDNNPNLWDTTVEGLAVKKPDVLRHLPGDCGVFICNIYYREIEVQLREMGIKHIEYFSDEFMPLR